MGDEKNALVINVKMRRMKAAPAYAALDYVGLLSCAGKISRFGRQARLGEHVDSGLTAYRLSEASDTGQNASQIQDAFRSLHYVAVTCLPSSAYPRCHHNFHTSFWGLTPYCVGPGPKKCAENSLLF